MPTLLLSIPLILARRKDGRNRRTSGRPGQLRHGVGRDTGASTADTLDGVAVLVGRAGLGGVGGQQALLVVLADGEVAAEVLGLLEAAGDVLGAEGAHAVVGAALGGLGALLGGHLDDEAAALDGVDEDEARLEVGVRGPGAEEGDDTTTWELVILGVDVKITRFTHVATAGVLGNVADVPHVEAVAVVGLVQVAVYNVVVVVDGALAASKVASVHGVLQITDVEDVRAGKALTHGAALDLGVSLIKLVVDEDEFL